MSREASVTSLLKVEDWSKSSSSRSPDRARWERWSSCCIRFLIIPNCSHALPIFGGREDAISRRILEASLHPLPLVVTPIWRGPSVWVARSVKVHRDGASATLTGIRLRLQRANMCAPV